MHRELYVRGEYLSKHPTWHVEDSAWKARQILRMIERNNLQPESICEIGCGAGEVIHQLYVKMPASTKFVGYEISPQAFGLCQSRREDRVRFYLKDLLQESAAYFDIVLAVDVFEHVEDYFDFLRSLTKTGKYKIFHIPLDLSVQAVLRMSPILKLRESSGHIHYFSKETALATLKDSGYEVLDLFYTATSIDLSAKSLKNLLTRVPRKLMFALDPDMAVRIMGGYSLMVLTK